MTVAPALLRRVTELQTGHPYPSKNNRRDRLVANPDGPLDPWFDKTWRPGDVEPVAA